MNDKENKTNKKDLMIKIILIIIIILLLLHNCVLIKGNDNKKPTGNVDIFEIQCESDSCKNNDMLIVSDNNATWKKQKNLRIFSNPMYEMDNKIAPGDSNIYQFVVKNNTKFDVKYSLKFKEDNKYKINMKYRLKNENEYVSGDDNTWDEYNKLDLKDIVLKSAKSTTYYLEWKWVSSDNDTSQSSIDDAYKLNIEIEAESKHE